MAVEWPHERDEIDLGVSRLADLLKCADYLELVLLMRGYSPVLGEAYMPPDQVSRCGAAFISAAIRRLEDPRFLPPGLDRALVEALLSRVGESGVECASANRDQGGVRRDSSQGPKSPTRRDLLFFYLIVKVSYLEAKAALFGRPESPADISHVNQAMQQLLGAPGHHGDSLAELRAKLYALWAQEESGGS